MPRENVPSSKVIMFGLAQDLESDSRRILSEQGHTVYSYPLMPASDVLALIDQVHADFVFCADERGEYKLLLEAIRQKSSNLPIVVVSRRADTAAWLDALQAGAADYCAPPFESISIRWILESALASRATAA